MVKVNNPQDHKPFLVDQGCVVTYGEFDTQKKQLSQYLKQTSLNFIVLEAENNTKTYMRFLSCLDAGKIVFLCPSYQFRDASFREFVESETGTTFYWWSSSGDSVVSRATVTSHSLLTRLEDLKQAGFIVRTSGSSGQRFKLVLHNPENFVRKYHQIGCHFDKTIAFSPAESIAGIETLLETYTHGKTLICGGDRLSPASVVSMIEKYDVDYFQTTPSFLNLFVYSGYLLPERLKSLKKIAFGSEPPQGPILMEIKKKLPDLIFMHTYGMSEIGILKTMTNQDIPMEHTIDSINPFRISDGFLEVKSLTPMLGYLNAENPYTDDGWVKTMDVAQVNGNYLKILGRASDQINLAGRKFYPSEVEEHLLEMCEINDVTIIPVPNELIGTVLVAKVTVMPEIDEATFRKSFKSFCEAHLPFYMFPHKIQILRSSEVSPRSKKIRKL